MICISAKITEFCFNDRNNRIYLIDSLSKYLQCRNSIEPERNLKAAMSAFFVGQNFRTPGLRSDLY